MIKINSNLTTNLIQPKTEIGYLAQQAMLKEVCLTPKPGLVDMSNSGAHYDMDIVTFINSINAITPWLDQFYLLGIRYAQMPELLFFQQLRQYGILCEQDMFKHTKGVNTHKGGIFAFSLLLSAVGRLQEQQKTFHYQHIGNEIANLCQDLIKKDFNQQNEPKTVGEKIFRQYGFLGARGEAVSGYMTVQSIALPIYCQLQDEGFEESICLQQTLIHLMAYNQDTNLIARGGLSGLNYIQEEAKTILKLGGVLSEQGLQRYYLLNDKCIVKHLSPGGSADLLAVTYFLSYFR